MKMKMTHLILLAISTQLWVGCFMAKEGKITADGDRSPASISDGNGGLSGSNGTTVTNAPNAGSTTPETVNEDDDQASNNSGSSQGGNNTSNQGELTVYVNPPSPPFEVPQGVLQLTQGEPASTGDLTAFGAITSMEDTQSNTHTSCNRNECTIDTTHKRSTTLLFKNPSGEVVHMVNAVVL